MQAGGGSTRCSYDWEAHGGGNVCGTVTRCGRAVGGLAVDAAGFSGHSDRDVVANGREGMTHGYV